MGGINHQPTSQVSLELTVPAAEALTQAMAELMLGNVQIEQHIQLTGTTHFGVGRQRLVMAVGHFDNVVSNLEITRSYVNRVLDMLGNPDYVPFDLSVIDADTLIEQCIVAGLLPSSGEVRSAVGVSIDQGYTGMFFEIKDLIEDAITKCTVLSTTTTEAIDGSEGTQGYFWQNVESNRTSWRPDFMKALTSLTNALAFWSASAAICTEVHLDGVRAGSLLTHCGVSASNS